jgi:hypothetical protein
MGREKMYAFILAVAMAAWIMFLFWVVLTFQIPVPTR